MMKIAEWIRRECEQTAEELLNVRRALHAIPEIGDELPLTGKFWFILLFKISNLLILHRAGDIIKAITVKKGWISTC